jgi:hypothetical protein
LSSSVTATPTGPRSSPRARRRALVAEGREHLRREAWSDALASFVEANRLARDRSTERRIVELRHRAALAIEEHAPTGTWPPTLADPFPDETGLPEITVDRLDAATLGGAILNHGALIVRGLATPEQADQLRRAIDHALDAYDDPAGPDAAAGWHDPLDWQLGDEELAYVRVLARNTGGLLAVDSPRTFFQLTELYEQSGVFDVVAGYLGERPLFSIKKTTLRRIREVVRPAWHQDGSFLGPEVRAVNIWLSLSHCGGDTATIGLDVAPGRIDGILETGTYDAEFETVAVGQRVVEGAVTRPMLTPEFHAGDALLFDERFLHRTSARLEATEERHAIESWLFAPSGFPSDYGGLLS